jgi:D-amino peptidase
MNALVAGEFNVPVVLVTGDDLTCDDAATYVPQSGLVAVKQCIDRYTARCLAPATTATLIHDAARESLGVVHTATPPVGPFTYEVFFDAANPVMASTAIPGVQATSETSVSFTLPTMREAIRCFKAVSTMASASTEPEYG